MRVIPWPAASDSADMAEGFRGFQGGKPRAEICRPARPMRCVASARVFRPADPAVDKLPACGADVIFMNLQYARAPMRDFDDGLSRRPLVRA